MDESLLELLNEITLYDFTIAVSSVTFLVGVLASQKKKISKVLNKWRKDKNEEEDFQSLVYELKDSIERLDRTMRQNQKDRDNELLQYRDDSKAIREEIYKIMNSQAKEINALTEVVKGMRERESKSKRAEFKERIEKIYRECHPNMKCTDMQLEVLKELIEEYEEHGGDNSFVHSTVQIEMYEWEVVKHIKE